MVKGSLALTGTIVLITLTLMTMLPNVHAALDSFRCGTKLVLIGDTKSDVLAKCGAPTSKGYNTWVYNRGTGKFTGIFRFHGNKLRGVESRSYGFVEPEELGD